MYHKNSEMSFKDFIFSTEKRNFVLTDSCFAGIKTDSSVGEKSFCSLIELSIYLP